MLVCDHQGTNMSALVVLAYIITKYRVAPQAALNYAQSKRPIIDVNMQGNDEWSFLCTRVVNPFNAPAQPAVIPPAVLAPELRGSRSHIPGDPTASDIRAAPPLDTGSPAVQELMMAQLIIGMGPSKSAVLPDLDVGRSGDTDDDGYSLVVHSCTSGLHPSLLAAPQVIHFTASRGNRVNIDSFRDDEQQTLHEALVAIDDVRSSGGRVLVTDAQGERLSALVALCYMVGKWQVSPQEALNYAQVWAD